MRFAILLSTALLAACSSSGKVVELSELDAAQLYEQARDAVARRNFNTAIGMYQEIESRFPYGPYAEQAQLEVAYVHYKNNEPVLAVSAADRFIRLHPTHENVDYAYYVKGLATFIEEDRTLLGRLVGKSDIADRDPQSARDAFNAFRDLTIRFPDSRYVDDARQRMAYLMNTLARHDIGVARFYLSRGAYVAVVNRAKYVIENYQESAAVEDALGLLATAYREMGMADLAEDALRVLEQNFPGSLYLSQRG